MRLELTRPNGHYPLKVARLPIPPSLHCFVSVSNVRLVCAQNRTRTCTSLNTRTWNERVYHSATWAYTDSSVVDTNSNFWAENETRTRDPNLGKVMLYQLSYFRIFFEASAFSAALGIIKWFVLLSLAREFRNFFLVVQYFKEQSVCFRFASAKVLLFSEPPNVSWKKVQKKLIFLQNTPQ